MLGINLKVARRITEFAKRNEISFSQMRDMILEWNSPMRIYSKRLNGTNLVRECYSVPGPSGRAVYNYEAKGYMVMKTGDDSRDWITIVLRNVEKITKDGKTFYVK